MFARSTCRWNSNLTGKTGPARPAAAGSAGRRGWLTALAIAALWATGCNGSDVLIGNSGAPAPSLGDATDVGSPPVGTQPVCLANSDCAALAKGACYTAVCEPKSQRCVVAAKLDGAACEDGDSCSAESLCQGAVCLATRASECDDANPCTSDGCVAGGGCEHKPTAGLCSDGNPCTPGDSCEAGACVSKANVCICESDKDCAQFSSNLCAGALQCSLGACVPDPAKKIDCDDQNPCTTDTCIAATGACDHQLSGDGKPCDDGDVCTFAETCQGLQCVAGAKVACALGSAACPAQCDPQLGCAAPPGGSQVCNDGNACTTNDTCIQGLCVGAASCGCATDADCASVAVPACAGKAVCQAGACVVDATLALPCDTTGAANCIASVCTSSGCTAVAMPDLAPCNDGDACTWGDKCQAGACSSGGILPCDDGNACTVDSCASASGCNHVPQATGSACSDGNPCTTGDACSAGVCAGPGSQCDDNAACTLDLCDPTDSAKCLYVQLADNAACDDGDPCTAGTACSAGSCVPSMVLDCDDANPCTVDACAGDACSHVAIANGATVSCDDGDSCTTADACNGAVCQGTPGGCQCQKDADCQSFEDGNLCNGTLRCMENGCVTDPGTVVSCTASGNPCTANACAPLLGVCQEQAVPVDATPTACDDGNACTVGDACGNGGTCLPGKPQPCDDGNACTADACDPAAGCTATVAQAAPCDDGNPCTFGDFCTDSQCQPGKNACECQTDSDCAGKDDADLCNGKLICQQGACIADGKAVTCPASNSNCIANLCDGKTGQCVSFAVTDGSACGTAGTCTTGGKCAAGVCTGATVLGCDDGNSCTKDSCEASGCLHSPAIGLVCDDGNPCTAGEVCGATATCGGGSNACACTTDAECTKLDDGDLCNGVYTCAGGSCQPKVGSPVSCDKSQDGPCQQNTCTPSTGACTLALAPTGTACSDGDACTTGETCLAGLCAKGSPLSCDDGNPCTNDACSPTTGCYQENSTSPCDDGNPCTSSDVCSGGKCAGQGSCECKIDSDCKDDGNLCNGVPSCTAGKCAIDPKTVVICDGAANSACAVNACEPAVGKCALAPVPDGTQCDDASVCTGKDQCVAGSCKGTLFNCDDSNPCTQDGCIPQTGCVNSPLSGPCDDGNPCTQGDSCTSAAVCKPGVDTCGTCKTASDCPDDGDLCNGSLTCTAGACVPVGAVQCPAGDACNLSTCDAATGNCILIAKGDGQACDDGTACTGGSACISGQCVGSSPLSCDDKNPCTLDTCDAKVGCQNLASPGACDDGNPCTSGDACSASGACQPGVNQCQCQLDSDCAKFEDGDLCNGTLICQGNVCAIKAGTPVVCPDSGQCSTTLCDGKSGQCVSSPKPVGSPCDDQNLCTATDACQAGTCQGQFVVCDDNNPCTLDNCDAVQGCVVAPAVGQACDDGNLCTVSDSCGASGTCVPGANQCACAVTADCAKSEDGNLCNGTLICQANQCVIDPKSVVTCADDGLGCSDTACDAKTGQCGQAPVADGSPCGGAELCGGIGQCKSGVCAGQSGCADDGNSCTAENCDGKGTCSNSPVAGSCDDGDACTVGDSCQNGACAAGANQCQCKVDGDCAKFDDGNLCNGVQKCVAGSCVADPGSAVVCPPATGVCSTSQCMAATGKCETAALPNGAPCDDSDACTSAGQCFSGTCLVGKVDCDDKNPCTSDACNAKTGCTQGNVANFPPVTCDDGDTCTPLSICQSGKCTGVFNNCFCSNDSQCKDDGDLCNGVPSCQGGTCKTKPGSPVTCDPSKDTTCLKNSCQKTSGQCLLLPTPAGTTCNDGNTCTGGDVCSLGNCVGVPANCDDGIACTLDSCDPKTGCVHTGQAKLCDDGNPCTLETCNGTAGCLLQPALGQPCDDGNACTSGDTCSVGAGGIVCSGGAKLVCDDKNPCTADLCDPKQGCVTSPQSGAACDDGDPCTTGDSCAAGACKGSGQSCDDANPCTVDACQGGKCLFTPKTGSCDDGSVCTTGDSCISGNCIGAGKVNCDDASPCTSEACDPKLGCQYKPATGASCDDGNACTAPDSCNAGKCIGTAKVCDDKNPCTSDLCDAATGGCAAVPKPGIACDDGSLCTTLDVCQGNGICSGNPSVLCDDGNACTNDACVAATGLCSHTPNTAPCSDGQVCTKEQCAAGSCVASPAPGTKCDDGNLCTTSDVCGADGSTCAGTPASCDDGIACTADACDAKTGQCSHTPPTGFAKDFDDGTIAPITTQSLSNTLKWQIDSTQFVSKGNSLYYGQILPNGTYTYNGGGFGGGTMTLPTLQVPATVSKPTLTLKVRYSKDPAEAQSCNGFTDRVLLQIDGQTAGQLCASTNGWQTFTFDLTASKGKTVQISSVFVMNLNNNNGQGLWVDDIAVSWSCP